MLNAQQLATRIQLLRKKAGLSQAQVATALGVSRPTVVAIEKGERRPADSEIVTLARILGVAVNDLLSEHRLLASASPRFRSAPRKGIREEGVSVAVTELETLASTYAELEARMGSVRSPGILETVTAYYVPGPAQRLDPKESGGDAARLVRGILDLGDAPILALDELLELEAGFRIFNLEMDSSLAAVFLWGQELGPAVALNRAHPPERRRFSLAHELGHYLRDREAGELLPASGAARRDPSEVFADAFAVELLLPAKGVRARFLDRLRAEGGNFRVADAIRMAETYGVSFEALLRRIEDLQVVPSGTWDRVSTSGFKVREAAAELRPGTAPAPPTERLPRRFRMLAVAAFDDAQISETEFAEVLGCDRLTARQIHEEESSHIENDRQISITESLLSDEAASA